MLNRQTTCHIDFPVAFRSCAAFGDVILVGHFLSLFPRVREDSILRYPSTDEVFDLACLHINETHVAGLEANMSKA
jgi:hypothetical protein